MFSLLSPGAAPINAACQLLAGSTSTAAFGLQTEIM
jgi:hypothetical protein